MQSLIERLENLIEAKISVVGFVSDQDPNDDDDDWAADMEVKVTLKGKEVAQLLGKQERVLQRAMEKLTEKQALALLTNGRNKVSKDVMRSIRSGVSREVAHYGQSEFGRRSKIDTVDWTENSEHWSAKIDAKKQTIEFEVEVGVSGEWK